jgi:hypothetical protein
MSAKKTAQGIEVRKVPFEFPPDFRPHWHPADPAWSGNGLPSTAKARRAWPSLIRASYHSLLLACCRREALPNVNRPIGEMLLVQTREKP